MNSSRFNLEGKAGWFRSALITGAVVLGVLLPRDGFALDPALDISQYNCQTWGRQNGLPVSGIRSIAQTKDGYLWMGTAIGLIRFEGTEFKVEDLGEMPDVWSSEMVDDLSKAGDGGLWVCLRSSSYGYWNGQTFSFQAREGWSNADPSIHYVRSLLESKEGTLWLGTDNAVLERKGSGDCKEVIGMATNALYKAAIGNVFVCYEDHEGRIWFGTEAKGVYYWQAGKVGKIPDPDLDSKIVRSLAVDRQGQVWVGAIDGLRCYDTNFARKNFPALNREVDALLVDRDGIVWIGTAGGGLALYRNGAYSFLRKTNGLANDYVGCLAEDREGSVWVGTREGFSQLTNVKFRTVPASENPAAHDAIAVAASRKGGIWIGSAAGLTYFDGKPKTYGVESGLLDPYVKRVFEASNGDVFLINGGKLVVFSDGKAVTNYDSPDMLVGMAEDGHGVVVSAGGALYRAGRDNFRPYVFTNGDPGMVFILNLASGREGEIWVASIAGVFRVKDGGCQRWGAANGLSNLCVQWVYCDRDGVVWGATLSGMFRLKDNQIRFVTRNDGLFDNNIYSVIPDDSGNLWVDSARGIFEITRGCFDDFADVKTSRIECVSFDGPESVKPSDKTTQEHMACKTADGRIWFPSANGVVEIDPAHVPINKLPLPIHIDSIRANGVEMVGSNSLVVRPGAGELEFHFTALSFIAPRDIKIRYLLEGYDKAWVEKRYRHPAHYTNLKPGRYKFQVIAANADGIWNENGDAIEIELQPHYYQTGWFKVLCGGLGCAALLGIWRLGRLRLQQQEWQKTRRFLEAEVQSRTAALAETNKSLQQRTLLLEREIEERKRMEREVEHAHLELLQVSRMAGMSEVATNVLHNVGNVLNSVNVSATLVTERVKKTKAHYLAKVAALLKEHEADLGAFIISDPRGMQLPSYLVKLSDHLIASQTATIEELELLRANIEHIKEIVAMQQSYAHVSGVKEIVNVRNLVEDSLRMNLGALQRHRVRVLRDFQDVPAINVEKHKILQILINLLRNAKYACDESGRADKLLTVRVAQENGSLKISVVDNGVGIPPENLNRIFSHGFTTRKAGHGFGLHSGSLAAREMGGALTVRSDGLGKGACFTLELPITSPPKAQSGQT